MPNRSQQQNDDQLNTVVGSQLATVDQSPEDGHGAPTASSSKTAAGTSEQSSRQTPLDRGLTSEEAIDLLMRAVRSLEPTHASPVAATISLEMRRLHSLFDVRLTEFRSFKALLEEAQRQQLVVLERTDSDLKVTRSHATGAGTTSPAPVSTRHLNDDLWRALLDWDPTKTYRFDRRSRRTRPMPTAGTSPDTVAVDSIGRDLQLQWRREFAAAIPDLAARAILEEALAESNPIAGFSRVAAPSSAIGRRWRKYLQERVLDRAARWADANGVALTDIERVSTRPVPAPTQQAANGAPVGPADERSQILAILAQLPTSDLLRLPIPVEYALKR